MRNKTRIRLIAVLIGGLAVLEGTARLYVVTDRSDTVLLPWGYATYPRSASNYVPHPFTAFGLNPSHPEHTQQGLRAKHVYGERTSVPRILVIGGSNVYGTQVRYEETMAFHLQEQLKDPGPVEVVNGGVGAFTTANLIAHLALTLIDLDPDVCVLDLGYTDMVARIRYPDFRTDYSHDYKSWDLPALPLWRRSVLLDRIASRLGSGSPRDPSIHWVCQQPGDSDFEGNLARSSNQPFERNLKTLIAICRAHDIEPVICTQATAFGVYPTQSDVHVWQQAMDEANTSLREVAGAEDDLLLIEVASELSEKAECFVDGRRMNGTGNLERAKIIAQALIDAGWID